MTLNPGGEVWVAIHEQYSVTYTCRDCCGEGRVFNRDGVELKCPSCYGHKTRGSTRQNWRPVLKTVHSVLKYHHPKGVNVSRVFFEDDRYFEQDPEEFETHDWIDAWELNTLFENQDACVAYCDDMNERNPEQNFG